AGGCRGLWRGPGGALGAPGGWAPLRPGGGGGGGGGGVGGGGGGWGGGGGGGGVQWRVWRLRRRWWLLRRWCGREILMAKLTPEQFADGVSQALGGRLVSLLLYGSAASGTHVPGRSDVNTLLICDAVDEGLFAALEPALARWGRAGNPRPLIRV